MDDGHYFWTEKQKQIKAQIIKTIKTFYMYFILYLLYFLVLITPLHVMHERKYTKRTFYGIKL